MGLLQRAYETYEYHQSLAGKKFDDNKPLAPVYHSIRNAQIEIHLSDDGSFKSAEKVDKADSGTVIPVTDASAGRSGKFGKDNNATHPLCEQLGYLTETNPDRFNAYIGRLERWAQSEYSHPTVRAVLKYLRGGNILNDLDGNGIITTENGSIGKGGINGSDYEKCLVRWVVMSDGISKRSWEDTELFNAYIKYCESCDTDHKKALCMISGDVRTVSENHAKNIVSFAANAKLISTNDSSNFTYRGRFISPDEAATVGYGSSSEAHNALSWIVANQGVPVGNRVFAVWNPKGKKVIKLTSSGFMPQSDADRTTPTDYYNDLRETLDGYRNGMSIDDDIVTAAFDAPTKGCLSVVYYNEFKASDFYDRIEKWYSSFLWDYGKSGLQSPPLRAVIGAAFGTERNGRLEVDDKIFGEQYQRLYHCIVDRSPIPSDIVMQAYKNACNPLAYSDSCRSKVLNAACALIRKFRNDKLNREEWKLSLDKNNKNRSYLFGRLLAVAELAERRTYGSGEEREPNAIRYQSIFSRRPMATWRIIEENLIPYMQKLPSGARSYYRGLIDEIIADLPADETVNRRLDDVYLLGYSHQRNEIYKGNKVETDDIEEE